LFAEKRDMPGGFKVSPLRLNEGLGALGTWDEAAIQARADKLAGLAAAVWAAPRLGTAVLDSYRPKVEKTGSYSIDDHEHLSQGKPMRAVFEAFRNEVLALDPCVSEEFYKPYVAYKAETNFVDVVPLAARLKLTLNMEYLDLVDPKGIARDVTEVGHWGNGDVEVGLKSLAELPYVMGLVRQAFEKQMGNAEVAA
jgi:predicted transport protein